MAPRVAIYCQPLPRTTKGRDGDPEKPPKKITIPLYSLTTWSHHIEDVGSPILSSCNPEFLPEGLLFIFVEPEVDVLGPPGSRFVAFEEVLVGASPPTKERTNVKYSWPRWKAYSDQLCSSKMVKDPVVSLPPVGLRDSEFLRDDDEEAAPPTVTDWVRSGLCVGFSTGELLLLVVPVRPLFLIDPRLGLDSGERSKLLLARRPPPNIFSSEYACSTSSSRSTKQNKAIYR